MRNSSEVSFHSSEVSVDSSEEIFRSSEEMRDLHRGIRDFLRGDRLGGWRCGQLERSWRVEKSSLRNLLQRGAGWSVVGIFCRLV